jgi:ribosomal protein S27AE
VPKKADIQKPDRCPRCAAVVRQHPEKLDIRCGKCGWIGQERDLEIRSDVEAAYILVTAMTSRANGFTTSPWWYGWALREAYLAGVKAERARREPGINQARMVAIATGALAD